MGRPDTLVPAFVLPPLPHLYAQLFPHILYTRTDQLVLAFATREMEGLDLRQQCPNRKEQGEGNP